MAKAGRLIVVRSRTSQRSAVRQRPDTNMEPYKYRETDHFRLETFARIDSLDFNDTYGRITRTAKEFSIASVTCQLQASSRTYQCDFIAVHRDDSTIFVTFPLVLESAFDACV
jgi:hypothetical protein